MLDMHSHILYGVDDGADNLDTSIRMLKIGEDEGIYEIIATPHYYKGFYENDYEDIVNKVEELNEKAHECGLRIKILPGQEVTVDKYTIKFIKESRIKGLNNSRYILIELPFDYLEDGILDIIYELRILGFIPIIAHPERYKFFNKNIFKMNDFIGEGCLFQINSGSITGMFGSKVKSTAMKLIKSNLCHFIASDAHSSRLRVPQLKNGLANAMKLDKNLEIKINLNAQLILNDCEPHFEVEKIKAIRKCYFINFFKKKGWRVDRANDKVDNF